MSLLLLAGTQEAKRLANLCAQHGIACLASLAGVTRSAHAYPGERRVGGFGGEAAQEQFLRAGKYRAIVDATHPYATQISARSLKIARRLNLPYLRVLRPEWRPGPHDIWHEAKDVDGVATFIPPQSRVFLATGGASIDQWGALAQQRTLFCRRIDPTDTKFPHDGSWIIGRPPFSVEDEVKLLKDYKIEWLVSKNSGGPTREKLDAARHLGVAVVMLQRPKSADCDHAQTVQEAMVWVKKQIL